MVALHFVICFVLSNVCLHETWIKNPDFQHWGLRTKLGFEGNASVVNSAGGMENRFSY